MTIDTRISILLSELKNNPKLLAKNTTGPRLEEGIVQNDPLFAGVTKTGPILLGAASLINSPSLFDVQLDLFILLKEQLTSSLKLVDVISFSQDKAFKDVVEGREDVSRRAGKLLRDVVEIDQFLKFLKAFKLQDTLSTKDFQEFLEHKKFVEELDLLQAISKEARIQKKEVVTILDKIQKKDVGSRKTDRVGLQNAILTPRSVTKVERLGIKDFPPQLRRGSDPKELLILFNLLKAAPSKKVKEIIDTRISILVPKARTNTDRVFVSDSNFLRTEFEKQELLNLLDEVSRKVELVKNSAINIRTNNLVARAIYEADRAGVKSSIRKKTGKPAEDLLNSSIFKFFDVNRGILEQYDVRDSMLRPSKSEYIPDRLFTKISTRKQSDKPAADIANTIVRAFINPNLVAKEELKTVNSILTPKAKLFVEKLIFDELIKLEMPIRLFTVANLRTQLARFLNKRIILPEVAKLDDNTLASQARVFTDRAGVRSKDRDAAGIGDVVFLFATQILEFLSLVQEVKKEVNKPRIEKLKLQDTVLTPRFRSAASKMGIKETSVLLFNKIPFELLEIETDVVKDVDKPVVEKSKLTSAILTPAIAEIITERFLTDDSFNPYLFNKGLIEFRVAIKDKALRKFQEKTDGIRDTLSTSEKGYAWMRDEEYTKGAYFLQPYVATIPPGRSRQF